MEKYMCDDRIDRLKLNEDIKKMTEEEFEQFKKKIKETNSYPSEYLIVK